MSLSDMNIHGSNVICSRKTHCEDKQYGSFIVSQEDALPTYHIERTSKSLSEYSVGDDIVINSIPTCIDVNGQKMFVVNV